MLDSKGRSTENEIGKDGDRWKERCMTSCDVLKLRVWSEDEKKDRDGWMFRWMDV